MGESVWSWSTTAASNATADSSINYAEGQTPGSLNNSARSGMAAIAKMVKDTSGALTTAGTSTAYTLTTNQGLATLADGVRIHAVVDETNTGAATLAVDGLTAKAIRKYGNASDVAIAAGELPISYHAIFQYDASANSAAGAWILLNPPALPAPGMLWGLTLSNNSGDATNDIDIAAGSCADSTNTVTITLASSITKRLDAAWAVGTNQGGIDTGAAANTTYHLWAIYRSDTGVSDVLFSTSSTAPTMPTNYTHKRRIGAIIRSGGAILLFSQRGDRFMLDTPIADIAAANPGTSAVNRTLSGPNGSTDQFTAILNVGIVDASYAAATFGLISSLNNADFAPATNQCNVSLIAPVGVAAAFTVLECPISTTSALRSRLSQSTADHTLYISLLGWRDRRGMDA